ncbi:energy transducer TonB [Phenylobacterium sp. J367]|uniref:energy transducer TonB n=1 Tax=Phenylobacterium sp. J367 TaxID=2898435 RepID=UPI0035ADF8A9
MRPAPRVSRPSSRSASSCLASCARWPSRKPGQWASLGPIGPYYPERAERLRVDGEARIDCRVLADNRLDQCRAVAAGPPGWGFDEASIRAAADGWIVAGPEPAGVKPPADGVWRFRVLFEQSKRRKRSR